MVATTDATVRFHVKHARSLRWAARRAAAGRVLRLVWSALLIATRRNQRRLSVTLRRARPYALSVVGLVCFVVSAFTVSRTLGWAAAGAAALLFEWHHERERGGR